MALRIEVSDDSGTLGTLIIAERGQVSAPEPIESLYLYDVELVLPHAVVRKQITAYRRHGWRRLVTHAWEAVI